MKKFVLFLVASLVVFAMVGCVQIVTETTTEEYTTQDTLTGTGTTTTQPLVYADLPDDEVEIIFWHIYGAGKTALLDQIIAEFEDMFPNVTITSTSQSDYNTLREKIQTGMGLNPPVVPTMALGYPDHFANYVDSDAAYSLDNFIYSNIAYEVTDPTSTIYGDTVLVGLDLADFVPSYLAENNQYVGHHYYSIPYSKSTETMAVNVDVLKAHVAEIRALGIEISDNGYLSHTTPLTLNQINELSAILTSSLLDANQEPTTDVANKECAYLVNYDSSGNMYINLSRQLGAPYTNSAGDIMIDNDTTRSMLTYIKDMFNRRAMVLPIVWDQAYGSTNFIYGDVCMSIGSTAGVNYNIPALNLPTDLAKLKLGTFDVDFVQIPQAVTADAQEVTLYSGTTPYTFTGDLSAVQQGPNIGIFKNASSVERLYAWLFIKYLTNTDNTARWAMDTGYLPARLSAYTSDSPIRLTGTFSTTYSDFLEIAQDFWAADGEPGWEVDDERWDFLYKSMVANIAKNQNEYYKYDPAFAAKGLVAGSAIARVEAGYCLENIITGAYTPEQALLAMKSMLILG